MTRRSGWIAVETVVACAVLIAVLLPLGQATVRGLERRRREARRAILADELRARRIETVRTAAFRDAWTAIALGRGRGLEEEGRGPWGPRRTDDGDREEGIPWRLERQEGLWWTILETERAGVRAIDRWPVAVARE